MTKKVILHPGRAHSIHRWHPWVFSGAIAKEDKDLCDGDLVDIYDAKENYLATGHYQDASIKVRIISFVQTNADLPFWIEKIQKAYALRKELGFTDNPQTNCYRLIHAEGDTCPGLIIDIYNHTAIVQCHSIGMHRQIALIVAALKSVFGESLQCIYDKSKNTLPRNYALLMEEACLYGRMEEEVVVLENGHHFIINYQSGQKTGFFLDQRDNRACLAHYVEDKKVLNAFCYTGGFSVYALRAGAALVHSVDASQKAIALCENNIYLNSFDTVGIHEAFTNDVNRFFNETDTRYEVIVLDPPAFAKNISKRHNAVKGYKRLNVTALRKIAPNGILFTFSCSQVIDRKLFESTLMAAAIEAGRQVQILHHLSQPADHPVSLFHPEGAYLKGLVLRVE